MKYWIENFMHLQEEATSRELIAYMVDKLSKACKLNDLF